MTFPLLLALGALVLAFVVHSRTHRLDSDLRAVRKRLAELETQVRQLREAPAAAVPPPVEAVAPTPEPKSVAKPEPEPEVQASPPPPPPPPRPQPAAAPKLAGEQVLTERWLVWLGGVALALGGAFMVKLSVEQGLLGPEMRVALGALTGIALLAGGHWLKNRLLAGRAVPGQVPPALVGAGGSMLFVSIYAARALYGMVNPLPAFGLLAAVAAVLALMSVAHGPFVALLGLAGAYALPALVRSAEPNALGLFAYLLVVSGALLALLRWRQWWWMAWVVLAASAGWTLVWLIGPWHSGDEVILGGYLLALFALFAAFRLGLPMVPALAGRVDAPMGRRAVIAAAAVVAVLMLPLAGMAGFSSAALALPLLLGAGFMAFGWRDTTFDWLPWISALLLVAVLAADGWFAPRPHVVAAVLGAALYGGGGVLLALRTPRPWVWAAGAAAVPPALLAVAYWRLSHVAPDWGWSLAALLLAAVEVAVAERFNRLRSRDGMEAALGAAATGVIAALALAMTFALSEAWLTVALSLLVAGIAWVEGQLHVLGLRKVALGVAAVVLVRLAGNPFVLDYALPQSGVLNWLLYGYGLPALAFAGASRLFRRGGDDLVVAVLEAGAITFATLLATLEIHVHLSGSLSWHGTPSLAETSLNSVVWAAGAATLFFAHRRGGSRVLLGGGWVLLALATAQVVFVQVLTANPLYSGEPVGERPLFNLLLLTYAAPAVLYGALAWLAPERPAWTRPACGGLAIALAFVWASFEVRHAFVGSYLDLGPVGQAEMWVYSVVWLLGGVAMLGGGIMARLPLLRRAGLGVVLLVVAKVFILDMAQLRGLWRALSFLGLGGVLVGIGGLYRRFAKYI